MVMILWKRSIRVGKIKILPAGWTHEEAGWQERVRAGLLNNEEGLPENQWKRAGGMSFSGFRDGSSMLEGDQNSSCWMDT